MSMLRTAFATTSRSVRAIHTTPVAFKSLKETVTDAADTVNKKVGKGLASAIETGEKATEATKETIGSATQNTKEKASQASNVAQDKASKASTVAQQKGNQAATGAREAKEDFQKEVRK